MSPERTRAARVWLAAVFVVVAAMIPIAPTTSAQTFDSELDPVRFGFAAYLGSGFYAARDETVWLFRIPMAFPIVSGDDRPFGVRLRLRATVGFYDFKPPDLNEWMLPDEVGTLSLLAGVEFPVPVRDNWTLLPFFDVGPAWDNKTSASSTVVGFGMRSRAEFSLDRGRRVVLWNELVRAADYPDAPSGEASFGKLLADAEFRFPLNWKVAGRRMAIGPFVTATWLFDPLVVGAAFGDPNEIDQRYEVGFKIGTESKTKVRFLPMPRLGLSYRFGQSITSVRVIFTSRY